MIQKNTGFTRLFKAMFYSYKGFKLAAKSEAAFQQELISACVLIPIAFFLDIGSVERILLIFSVVFVLVVELLNTALEAAVDRVGTEHHPLAGQAKDLGSAAVFLSIFLWAFVWITILFPLVLHYIWP